MAAALLDARGAVLEANRRWQELSVIDAGDAIARLQAANLRTEIELAWPREAGSGGSARRLRLRAAPFEHEGSHHVVVMHVVVMLD